jgi:hypothetical protein
MRQPRARSARGKKGPGRPLLVKDLTLVIEVSQDSKGGYILTSIINYFGVGKVYHEIRRITKYRLVII